MLKDDEPSFPSGTRACLSLSQGVRQPARERPGPSWTGALDPVLARCFSGLEDGQGLLLAVSGGPDSIALLLMAARWGRSLGRAPPAIHVATVDHGLRPEARAEAQFVATIAASYDLPHAILTWTGPKPASRLQERARAARYALLASHAKAVGATRILTAHHADDQAETVLLRLGRGSGIGGLAGMRRLSSLAPGVELVRPLLDLTKADLTAVCRAESCDVVEDPSNDDPAFMRARLRAQAPALAALGLDTPGLLRLGRRMARADAALEAEAERVEAILAPDRGAGVYSFDLSRAQGIAPEIRTRLMRRAIAYVAPRPTIRLERLEALAEALWSAFESDLGYRATLAGTRISLARDKVVRVWPEGVRKRGRRTAAPRLRPN